LVERLVWDQEVAGSNPVTPTTSFDDNAAMNSISSHRAVAAATGRRFESCHPDHRQMNRMKAFLTIVAIAFSIPVGSLHAQEPPLPAKTEAPSPSPAGTRPQLNIPDIPMAVDPPKLVPDASSAILRDPRIPALPKTAPPLSELDAAFQKSPLAQETEEQRRHLEWRQLQNRVAHDPDVVAAKAAATTAKTDLEKRVRLRAYYNVYYAHMRALASGPEIKSYLEAKKAAALEGLAQRRVRPESAP
jgi:hypothetical protein